MIDVIKLQGVTPIDYRNENGDIIATVVLNDGEIDICPNCGGKLYKHGQRSNTFADLPIQNQPVKLEVIRPRYRCKDCHALVTANLEFIDDKRRASHRLVEYIQNNCLEKTFSELAENTGLAVNTIKSITLDYISQLEKTVQFETPTILGVNELTILDTKRTAVTNLSMNCLFDILPKTNHTCILSFLRELSDRNKVEWVIGNKNLLKIEKDIKQILPNADLIIIGESENKLIENYKQSHEQLNQISLNLTRNYSFEVIRAKLLYNKFSRYVGSINSQKNTQIEYGANLNTTFENLINN